MGYPDQAAGRARPRMPLTIARLVLGGGILALCPMPGRGGAYAADLYDLLAFGPALVVTLATDDELAAHGARGIGGDLARQGVEWLHLPIADFSAPDAAAAAQWPGAAVCIRAALSRRNKVVIHCLGGCGRSGMAALRLMVEAGEAPETALTRLRAVRPCAVERPEQYAWAAGSCS